MQTLVGLTYILVGLFLFVFVIKRIRKTADFSVLFLPVNICRLTIIIVYCITPFLLIHATKEDLRYDTTYQIESFIIMFLYVLLFILFYEFTVRLTSAERVGLEGLYNIRRVFADPESVYPSTTREVLVFVIALISFAYVVIKVGVFANYYVFLADRNRMLSGYGLFLAPMNWMNVLLVLGFTRFFKQNNHPKFLFRLLHWGYFASIFGFIFISNIILGSRSRALVSLVYIMYSFIIIKGLKLKSLVVISCIVLGLATAALFIGNIRSQISKGVEISSLESNKQGSSLLAQLNFVGGAENLLWVVENMKFSQAAEGDTIIAAFLSPIPRFIWENKPVGGGPFLRNLISPGSYDLKGGQNLTSYSPGLLCEFYCNFHLFGAAFAGVFAGIAMTLASYLLRRVATPLGFAVVIIIVYKMVSGFTGELLGTVASMVMIAILYPLLTKRSSVPARVF